MLRLIMLGLLVFLCRPVQAFDPGSTGVVLMHGKWGNPSQMSSPARRFEDAGFKVKNVEMAWSGQRLFDRSYDQALAEIAQAVQALRDAGAVRVVVAGQSLGGNAALTYAARFGGIDGVIAFAPAHLPETSGLSARAAADVARAREMVAQGQGTERGGFTSYNDGNRSRPVHVAALDYLSYYAPDGAAALSQAVGGLPAIPVLVITGQQDPTAQVFAARVRPRFPSQAVVTDLSIPGNHMAVPEAGAGPALDWLKETASP